MYFLTMGLLASMCIRYDHGFFSPCSEENSIWFPKEDVEKERKNIVDKMIQFYFHSSGVDDISSRQLSEEIHGLGFYSRDNDHSYEVMWSRDYELMLYAERAIQQAKNNVF